LAEAPAPAYGVLPPLTATQAREPTLLDHRQPQRAAEAWRHFVETPLDQLLARAEAGGEPAAATFDLFRDMLAHVPAYRRFLADQGIDPATIRAPEDLKRLPLATKANYVQRYPLAELVRGGKIAACDMMAVSSGSTGKPTFWPRSVADEMAIAERFEQVFCDSFAADQRRTLAVVCFALGSWVGGLFTLACCRHLAAKGYPILSIAPGMNKPEIYRILAELAPGFEQTVLLGYPPYLKDVIDGGPAAGIDWPRLKIRLVMAGEVFSEEWRTLVGGRLGSTDHCYDFASLYGTADAGVLANETPLSIHIRRFLASRPDAARELFGEARLPTLAQYDPYRRYFEAADGTLLFSGDNGAPLLRYHIADNGGLIPYHDMLRFLTRHGFDPLPGLGAHAWRGARRLPFVYVFGRANFAVSYFGANVYPENIAVGLEQPEIAPWTTGKFVVMAREGLEGAPELYLAVELAQGVEADSGKEAAIAEAALAQLLRLNTEFANYTPAEYRRPRVELKPAGDPDWFPVGVKHRYSRR
jgi:phenylacetate-CoA ligase